MSGVFLGFPSFTGGEKCKGYVCERYSAHATNPGSGTLVSRTVSKLVSRYEKPEDYAGGTVGLVEAYTKTSNQADRSCAAVFEASQDRGTCLATSTVNSYANGYTSIATLDYGEF